MLSPKAAERLAIVSMSATDAVALIPNGSRIAMGLGVSQPPALLSALADRARRKAVGGLSLYYLLSTRIAGETVLQADLSDRIRPVSLFHSAVERTLDAANGERPCVEVLPTPFHQVPRVLCEQVRVDTLLVTTSPMDEAGHFSLGTNTDYALSVARSGARIILEVNRHMPRVSGDCLIHVSDVTAVVENHVPLQEMPDAVPGPADLAIATIIAGLVEDGDCLQMGIGAIPQVVCAKLGSHRNLGIHTELLTPGLAALMRSGVVDNSRKQIDHGRSVFTFAMGGRDFYEFMDEHPTLEARPVEYVNDPAVIARNDKVLSVNATLEIDLDGACNSESVRGLQYSASGGQLDFVRGAYASRGGRSIIACHSTAANGTISRIVPVLHGPVTTPRNDTHIVVTEHGWVDLKGKTLVERARALIALAAPEHREHLEHQMRVRHRL
ncbi:acetyl-CoA hydrolase/transferase family protein [Glacieibacterium sp.]|uniref:acetyl-CoA hydrolase/transferase family protein n=1 Tax=Glacieibacterium sp. TaxID=2860237 RepID=UPI003AFFEBD8